jgi:hypothetical protein
MSTATQQTSDRAAGRSSRIVVGVLLGALVLAGIVAAWVSVSSDDVTPIVMSQPAHPFQGGRKAPAHPVPTIPVESESLSPEVVKPGPLLIPAPGIDDPFDTGRKGFGSPPRPQG